MYLIKRINKMYVISDITLLVDFSDYNQVFRKIAILNNLKLA